MKAGGEEGGNVTDLMGMNLRKLQERVKEGKPEVLQFMRWQRVRHNLAPEQQYYVLDITSDAKITKAQFPPFRIP